MSNDYEFELTADEIEEIDEYSHDLDAIDATLKRAMTYHSNRRNELQKKMDKWWRKVLEPRGMDPSEGYRTKKLRGKMVVRKETEEERSRRD